MGDRRRLLPAVAAGVAVLTGCAGIPTGGSVHVGRAHSATGGLGDVDVRVLPPGPLPGMSPSDIVHGFLRALVNREGSYEIARSYLTTAAAASWDARSGVTTYDDGGVTVVSKSSGGSDRTLLVRAPRIGRIDERGDFSPRTGTVRATFQLVRQSGKWRISRLPPGVLLSTLDAQRAFRLANVYYPNQAGTTLVPEQVLLRPEARGVTTALLRSLLSGPGPWIAPAVRSAIPPGVELVGNVPVDDGGTAEVNLSAGVRRASGAQLQALSAQIVWTLRQVTEITGVRLLADGSPLPVPGVPLRQPRNAWARFDPAAAPALDAAFFSAGRHWRGVQATVAGLDAADGLSAVALSHDGRRYAGVRPTRSGAQLVVGRVGRSGTVRLTADHISPPTFDPLGAVFAAAERGSRRWIAQVTPTGDVRQVVVGGAALVGPVQRLQLSRDGARMAAVVGSVGRARLLVGRVTTVRGVTRLDDFRDVLGRFPDIRGLAWDGADQLLVTAGNAGGGREIVGVDVDGYSARSVSTAGIPAEAVDIAAAPGQPRVVQAGHVIWIESGANGWRRVGRGRQPSYAD